MSEFSPWRFSTAPMMEWSTPATRWLWRQLTQHTLLYTEMVTTGALLNGDQNRFLDFDAAEHPVALQLGGSNPAELAQCAKIGQNWGYDEINLNVGCPSDRVQKGMIGAALMAHSELVKDGMKAMLDAVDIPVTIKHRIGIDDHDSYEFMRDFVGTVAESGCKVFIVHARKAILKGLSPKENREIPPLQYDKVIQLKQDFPDLTIVINGGIKTLDESQHLLDQGLDGVMLGRAAYQDIMVLSEVDQRIFGDSRPTISGHELVERYCHDYIAKQPGPLRHSAKHLMGLFHGVPGGRKFRRYLSENIHKDDADIQVILDALALVAK
ncbi:tRNA dihydrouridine(20/20a) synthase DusA [Salinibius halmophilus]|uniref:tRNA dihydrouridine(20/20a) synthase DusA n=1 Tax=Salinibius halmophilus TaxID=1853216 RepID=UPI000E671C2B|nr:tRNA dihydrouridine(20/20a) synthase DusA [Salinibius halmophilus]